MFTRKDTYNLPNELREWFETQYPCIGYENGIEADPTSRKTAFFTNPLGIQLSLASTRR